jgi:RNA polymerase sigma-70 factor (sigma-E family)
MGVGGEPVNTVVDSIVSQSSDTISDDSTTVDDRESLGGLLGRNEAATDPVLESTNVDAIGAPSADSAGDAVADKAADMAPAPDTPSASAGAPILAAVDSGDVLAPVDSGDAPDVDAAHPDAAGLSEAPDAGDAAVLDGSDVFDVEVSADGLQTADDNDFDNDTDDGGDNEVRNLGVDCEPPDAAARPTDVTETLEASMLLPDVAFATEAIAPAALVGEAFSAPTRRATAVWDAADAVTEIYHVHYNQFVRLAVLLLHDVQTAEEVVQESFEAMHVAWRRLNDKDKALQYLRQTVVNKSRSVLRHRKVVDMHAPKPAPDEPSAEQAALVLLERTAVAAALRSLPERQREAIALRYYADFSEADIAKAMGISKGAVKSHTARAMATLKTVLSQQETS